MRYRTTLLLLAAVLVLGAFIAFFERKTDSTGVREELARKVLRVNPESVSYLLFESTNLVVECAKEDGTWMMLRPVRARADADEIDRILSGLRDLPRGEIITPEEQKARGITPAQYGLDQPRARVTWGDNLRRRTLLVGRDAPLGGAVYVREDPGADIVATGTNLVSLIPASSVGVRDHAVFHGAFEKVRRLEISGSDGFVRAVRTDRGRWLIQQPIEARAAPIVIQGILDNLFNLRVEDFVADSGASPVAYGLDDPAIKVTVGLGDKDGDTTLLVGNLCPTNPARVYAKLKGSDSIIAVATNVLAGLRTGISGLRDQRLMTMSTYDFSYFRAQQGEHVIELRKDDTNGWQVVQPKPWAADDPQVRNMLASWAGASVIGFIDHAATNLAAWGLEPPAQVLRFARRAPTNELARVGVPGDDEVVVRVSSQRQNPGRVIVKLDHEDALYEILSDVLDTVSYDPLNYRSREVLRLNADDVTRITRTRGGAEESIERSAADVFLPAQPYRAVVDQDAIKDVLMTVSHLRAARFVADDPKNLAEFGLKPPQATLTLGLRGESGIGRAILFGAEAGSEGIYAMLRGQDVVFVLDPLSQKKLLQELSAVPASSGEEPVDLSTNKSTK